MRTKTIAKLLIAMALICGVAHGQELNNPNKLPLCPTDIGARYHNCWGTFSIADGKYVGEWKDDKIHGLGTIVGSDGWRYVGEFKNAKYHGQGTLTGPDGEKYVGEFKDNEYHGQGESTLANGDRYVGQHLNGKRQGKGTATFVNGSKYVGEFKDDQYHGQGTYTSASGDKYAGYWKDGNYHGQGSYTYANGHQYVGQYRDGKSHGLGKRTLADGSWYYGEWKDGIRHGQGIMFYSHSGNREEGIWSDGKFIREAKVNLPNLNNNTATNTDRSNVDRERQQLTEDRPKNESQKNENSLNYEIFAIKPQFDWVESFQDGLAAFRIGDKATGKFGFIDKQGQIVIKPIFDKVRRFSKGLCAVRIGDDKTGKWGFIDKKGDFVIQPQFEDTYGFQEELAAVEIGKKTGFIDKHGNFLINPIFDAVRIGFYEGLAAIRIGSIENGKWGFIDRQGKIIIKPQFGYVMNFKNGFAPVSVGSIDSGKWGFVDTKGNLVIEPQYKWAWGFEDGLAAVQVSDGSIGFIDKTNKFVIQPEFSQVGPFKEGLAFARIGDFKTGKWGVIDKTGKFVINPQFSEVGWGFEDGVASVHVGNKNEAKSGYINRLGEFLVEPKFHNYVDFSEQAPAYFSEGFAANCVLVNLKRKCGFISKDAIQVAQANNPSKNERSTAILEKNDKTLSLTVLSTKPDPDGLVVITVQTNADTSSLKINGEEQGGRADGNYSIKKVARVGQDTQFTISAVDINGNSDIKTITVSRIAAPAADTSIALKPEAIKRAPSRDAVAIIIGIQNYKRVPKAEFANNDAREFNEYAIRALGIKPEKIKMLLDEEADEVNIVKAFENWLPIQVNKDKTDVYVFYSGHGLPAPDGKSLYFLPHGVDKELLSRTAVAQNEIVAALTAAKPKSVTMFIDACYSGQTRGGDVLIPNEKPVVPKLEANPFPANFTVITASANDQTSLSSPELKHGIFSFYLMKGMEGDADANQDGKITVGEMQDYLSDKVARQATTLGRKQNTQLVGDSSRVLVGR